MSFNYNGYSICDMSVLDIHGRTGIGVAQLCFSLRLHVKPWESGFTSFGEMQTSIKVSCDQSGESGFLGLALPERATRIDASNSDTTIMFMMTLSNGQLDALETMRAGNGLRFSLSTSAVGSGERGNWPLNDESSFHANLSKWADVLHQLGGDDHLVIGLPIPRSTLDHPMRNALERLSKARAALVAGRYDAVVSDCRLAIESAAQAAGRFEEMKGAWRVFKDGKQSLSKAQREVLIFESGRNYAHLAHHESGEPEVFSRADAHMMLGITVAAIAAHMDCSGSTGSPN